eukprot:3400343-Rhodomonas_salina.1
MGELQSLIGNQVSLLSATRTFHYVLRVPSTLCYAYLELSATRTVCYAPRVPFLMCYAHLVPCATRTFVLRILCTRGATRTVLCCAAA